jgi:hypothetical protein
MRVLEANELERLVRGTFPVKAAFSLQSDLGLTAGRLPAMAFVHGGPDPFLDRQVDEWLHGAGAYVGLYPLLNRLCSTGALPPGDYAVTPGRPH